MAITLWSPANPPESLSVDDARAALDEVERLREQNAHRIEGARIVLTAVHKEIGLLNAREAGLYLIAQQAKRLLSDAERRNP